MSKYFKLEELLQSKTALAYKIENLPSWQVVSNLERLAAILDIVREKLGIPITVTSGFRGTKLNAKVKGSKGSQHMLGEAADITCKDNAKLFNTIKELMEQGIIEVGQLIWEYGTKKQPEWVHVSLPNANHHNEIKYIGVK